MSQTKITKDDIKEKFEDLEGGLTKAKMSALPALPMVAGAVGLGIFVVALYLGFRLGKKRNAIIEIKRI